ncbi:hypothetical protein AA313_de0205280 [Arthrobotrys entomopaga]|nr:hypothetical protein AA313_de0205280 [Arthrobotrys entomopaga]
MKFFTIALLGLQSTFGASLPTTDTSDQDISLVKRGGGAFSSCFEGNVETRNGNQIWLNLRCGNGKGGQHWNHVNLNDYIINNGGKLYWQRNGGLGGSCWLTNDGATGIKYWHDLYIFCKNGKGGATMQSIDLNEHFVNRNGDLRYE